MDDATAIGPAYTEPTVPLGDEPSVVYRIVAPGVVEIVTLCADVYVPGDGLNIGAATVSPPPEPDPPPPPPQAVSKKGRSRKERILWRDFILDTSRQDQVMERLHIFLGQNISGSIQNVDINNPDRSKAVRSERVVG